MPSIRALALMLAELVAPTACAACDAPVGPTALFCATCAIAAQPSDSPEGALAYGGSVAEAIHRFKFGGRADLGDRLGRVMIPLARALAVDVVVPVPLHPRRLAHRGYNQAALLARPVARAIARPLAARALERVRDTPMQSSLDGAARRKNLEGALRVRAPGRVRGRSVLLVDDVLTTGSTMAACARSLHEVGALSVTPLVLACREGLAL